MSRTFSHPNGSTLANVPPCPPPTSSVSFPPTPSHFYPSTPQDPNNVLGPPQGGHIARRMLQKERMKDQVLDRKLRDEALKAKEELEARRAARTVPTVPALLVDFFLETEADEMEFEVARCRGQLDDKFFKELDLFISQEKFAPGPEGEDRLAELEGLKLFLVSAVARLDAKTQKITAPAERLKKLLTAPDKKAAILEMAAANEIDKDLLALMDVNIETARQAGQPEQVIQFFEKIKAACQKYAIVAESKIEVPKIEGEAPQAKKEEKKEKTDEEKEAAIAALRNSLRL
jgi:hypothetical protein